ncbi:MULTISPECIES: extracellular solute-binding protein [unclassified Streptomyces]|uniref:extracellular solute-binding protein n=1 Tax=unclassified Streptomyces TaxID=2593676 RepID=UPI000BF66788|nr:extracellular solute-binding protein [Streptomyces sp. Ru87]PGH47523.1 ABC transporter substrate-binding protein [Streptomyces sp. Ru87]
MTLSRRSLLAGTLAGAATTALAGCGSANTNPVAGQSTAIPEKPTTITWWCHRLTDRRNRDLAPLMIDAFERRHPTVKVRLLRSPSDTDTNRTTLTTQIASGSPTPDVYLGDVVWPGQFAHNSLALPLDQFVPKDYWKRYPAALIEACSGEGGVHAFPFFIDQSFLFYRRDLLDKHGLRVPRSWEELADSAARVRDSGDVASGFVWQGSVYEGLTVNFTEFLADAGGSVLGPDGSTVTVAGDAGERALTYLRDLVATGVSPSAVTTYIEQDSLDAFLNGSSLFLRNWAYAWAAANAEGAKTAGRVGVVPRPGFEGRDGAHSGLGGWSAFINPHTEKLGASLAFARFLAGDGGQEALLRESSYIPALSAALDSPLARRLNSPVIDNARKLELVPRPSSTPYYPKVSKALYTRANSAIGGSASVRASLSAMETEVRSALKGAVL